MKYFDRSAVRIAAAAALVVALLIFVGSNELKHFDWALTTYAVGTMFAAFAVVYRDAAWAQRPPTRMYLKRGVQMFMRRSSALPRNTGRLGNLLLDNFVLQKFITERVVAVHRDPRCHGNSRRFLSNRYCCARLLLHGLCRSLGPHPVLPPRRKQSVVRTSENYCVEFGWRGDTWSCFGGFSSTSVC